MKTIYILFFSLLFTPLFSNQKITVLNSEGAKYDGTKCILTGGVTLSHELGKVSAKCAILEKKKQKSPSANAALFEDVVIEMKSGGILFSDSAIFNESEKKAIFSSGEKKEFVLFTDQSNDLEFSAKQMTIQKQDDGQLYILAGDIRGKCGAFGDIVCQDMIYLKKNKASEFTNIDCLGKTKITLKKQNCSYEIMSSGEINIDNDQKKIKITSPQNDDGVVESNHQLLIQDQVGKIFANSATISYTTLSKNASLKKAEFFGNVRLINRDGPLMQYVMSERATLDQQSCRMHFFSTAPKRVICYDRPNNLEISAPELKVFRDKTTNKDNIKGIGDVRFHLMEKELEELKKNLKL